MKNVINMLLKFLGYLCAIRYIVRITLGTFLYDLETYIQRNYVLHNLIQNSKV